jgi:tetratricopeptide (TPR) repeat protein
MAQLTTQDTFDLALQHHQAGRLQEAEQLYRQVLAQQPEHAIAMHHLGLIAHKVGRNDAAVNLMRQAIALDPNLPDAYNNLGAALQGTGQLDEAIAAYRQAIVLQPIHAEAHSNLGSALKRKGQLDEAIAVYRRAIALNPNFPEAHNNLGNALRDKGQLDEAITAFRQAIALRPDYADAHCSLAVALLARKDFQEGWEEYEWRWKGNARILRPPPQKFIQPQWDGRPLESRTILLYTEQGFGDAIQFIRYVPLVAERGGKIIIACQAQLQRLFKINSRGWQIVSDGEILPRLDLHCPLLSLPRVFHTTLPGIPQTVSYLQADAEAAIRWQLRLTSQSPIVNVGLAWAGSPTNTNDRNRSMKLASLAPLAQVPGVRFISLQKGKAAVEAKTPPVGMQLIDWTEDLKDFADTAALIANLDLVIAVDTAVVHLAGAMGKPVWTLLPFVPDWRWLLERDDSPWYPSMRLFRQPSLGDWDSVIARVVAALSHWIENRA